MQDRRAYAGLLFVIYGNMFLYGFIQTMRGIIYPLIKSSYGASYSEMGLLVLLVQLVRVVSCVISGIILGRAGFRKTIFFGFSVAIAGMFFFRFADVYWIAAGFILIIQLGLGSFDIGINGVGVQIFTKNSSLMMNLLHFFYGLGSAAGPWFGGLVANNPGLGWRNIYLVSLIPTAIMALCTFILFPSTPKNQPDKTDKNGMEAPGGEPDREKYGFRWAISNSFVWRLAACLGFVGALEYGITNWSGLYLLDVFGMDPKTTGAAFVALYYLLFTASRLLIGFITERAGYLRSVVCAIGITILILIAGFALGRNGVWLLPVSGLFMGCAFPTILAMSIGIFGPAARAASSTIIVIAFSINGITQYLIGLINRFMGTAWGYRSCVVFGIVLLLLLLGLQKNAGAAGEKTAIQ